MGMGEGWLPDSLWLILELGSASTPPSLLSPLLLSSSGQSPLFNLVPWLHSQEGAWPTIPCLLPTTMALCLQGSFFSEVSFVCPPAPSPHPKSWWAVSGSCVDSNSNPPSALSMVSGLGGGFWILSRTELEGGLCDSGRLVGW